MSFLVSAGDGKRWQDRSGTVAVLALAAGLINVCLVHRMTVTRPDVVAAARAAGVDPAELTVPGVSVAFYTAMVTVPVVAVVGQSCVQALRTSWALWRLAGDDPAHLPRDEVGGHRLHVGPASVHGRPTHSGQSRDLGEGDLAAFCAHETCPRRVENAVGDGGIARCGDLGVTD